MRFGVLGLVTILLSGCSFFHDSSGEKQVQEAYYVPVIRGDGRSPREERVRPVQISDKKLSETSPYTPVLKE
ncbi:hypothetical protein DN730_10135 [Marinomonas piezotolerans]|uniref:Uncharacterized protein n=1 Tax=Marinomonas piezotolerans TaxID=2213058 RepID=A0A370UAC3_9GAMM|nr:hypothetical protein [Marinomonas piezotolerans]RDL44732.1 hypothetical protein DN730_10135 [Marinomonas piezotolerans]